jgi:hypothetical protein
MSGISRSFKVPSFIKSKKRKISHSLPTFNWENVSNLKELGIGSFGVVYSANYVGATDNEMVVVKKLRGESEDAKRRFLKEAEMLNTMKHQNITRFFGFSDSPYGIMMENVAFDFAPFGLDKAVTTLEDFYHYVDCECNFESFSEVLPVCMRDAVAGLDYLLPVPHAVSPAVPQAAPPHVPTAVPPAVCPPSQPPVPHAAPTTPSDWAITHCPCSCFVSSTSQYRHRPACTSSFSTKSSAFALDVPPNATFSWSYYAKCTTGL